MSGVKKQVLSNAIDILLNQGNLPEKLDGKKLYGEALEGDDALKADCRVYQLSNGTGNGQITVYQVFNGIELYYNDIHLAYCNQDQVTAKNIIEINHCYIGRYECSFGENSCCYLSAGDLSIGSAMKKKSFSTFPLNHYHGISIIINLEKLLPEVRQIMELLNIDLNYIEKNICKENRLCIVRANPSIEHIFSELYHVREQRKAGYIKIKVLELLLFLSDLGSVEEMQEPEYYNQNQVKLSKEIAAFITEDLTMHYTIEQLSERFGISMTTLKKGFHGVYGTSVYSWLRNYRMQTAQKLLLETELSVAEIAHQVGYENPNKFSTAFKSVYEITPTRFRNNIKL